MDFKENGWENVDRNDQVRHRDGWRALVDTAMKLRVQ
jgi:hypothetical protein